MTKSEFVAVVAEKTGATKKDVALFVDAYHETVVETLKSGDRIVFPGIFKAEMKDIAERKGRNPQTGEEITLPARKKIKVSVTAKL